MAAARRYVRQTLGANYRADPDEVFVVDFYLDRFYRCETVEEWDELQRELSRSLSRHNKRFKAEYERKTTVCLCLTTPTAAQRSDMLFLHYQTRQAFGIAFQVVETKKEALIKSEEV